MSAEGRDLLLTNAVLDGARVGLRVKDGLIAEIGPEFAESPDGNEPVLDADGALLVPPLVNSHTHSAMTLFRGHGDDLPLMRWLQEAIWPVEARIDAEDVYWGARLACLEMIRTGTTSFWDMYWQPEATARAVTDAGIRSTIGGPMIDPDTEAGIQERNRILEEELDHLDGFGDRIRAAVAPHSIYTVGTESLEFAARLADERKLPLQIHLSETEKEVADCIDRHGLRPAQYLDRLGLLGERTLLAHGVWLDRAELELIAERGATVISNPVANMKLAVGGIFPYPQARDAGVRIGLGTDGPGSNNSLDLFSDLKAFALAQRHAARDAEVIPAGEAWAIATGRRSELIGVPEPLAPGRKADFLLLDPDRHELALGDLESNLVYTASGSVVRSTVVGGRTLMDSGRVEDAEEIIARARERSLRLGLGSGPGAAA
ncbi:MAG: amidohydrolase [Thermoleophilia bacterium]|nr:amidohydrolase [Thermoleophilia bacterium]